MSKLLQPDLDKFDLIPKGQYDYVPKGKWVSGPADRFLLVPKNRYRVSLLPGMSATAELGIGWVTESNTPEQYDRLWGDPLALDTYKSEGDGVRARMPGEIVSAVASAVDGASRIADIGCGVGELLMAARDRNAAAALTGCDFSAAAISKAKVALPGADLRVSIIDKTLPYADGSFDVVFCTDVLEHLEYPRLVAAELVRVCRPGGIVVIVVPDGDVDQFFGHLWFFNVERLSDLLSAWPAEVKRLPDCKEFIGIILRP